MLAAGARVKLQTGSRHCYDGPVGPTRVPQTRVFPIFPPMPKRGTTRTERARATLPVLEVDQ
eukprot:5284486-Pyramimonas_sp.AAC.1